MKKLISLFLVLSFGLFLSSCGNKSELKEYKNEVTYDEFISEFEKVTENSTLNTYQEKDFYYSYNKETITILDGKETIDYDKVVLKHDIDSNKLNISNGNDYNEVYDSNNPMYFSLINKPEGLTSIFFQYYDGVKYYIDGDVFTVVWPIDPNIFIPMGGKMPESTSIYQIQIKENSIKVVETTETKEENKKTITLTIKEFKLENIDL